MINLSKDDLAQFAHVGWGYLFTTLPVLLFNTHLHILAPLVIMGAAIKEYADCHGLEDESTSGGVSGSWKDFSFWCVGVLIAIVAIR